LKPVTPLPHLAAPAQRALAEAGITCLEDLSEWQEADVARLHGIGPNALKLLKEALQEKKITRKKPAKSGS
jgi:predicted flap endonuclease-1-like 5' DNA nuclease